MALTFPWLLALGALFAAVTIAVHLLNLRRRKPIRWAAMQLLVESERKSRSWVRLKDLLLMAARALLVALLGLIAARPLVSSALARWFASEPTHHIVLLDDSFSMGETGAPRDVWGVAKQSLEKLVETAALSGSGQRLSVVRLSDCALVARDRSPVRIGSSNEPSSTEGRTGPSPNKAGSRATEVSPVVTADLSTGSPERQLGGLALSETSLPLADCLPVVQRLCQQTPAGQRSVVYVLSDFRQQSVAPAEALAKVTQELSAAASAVNFIACAREPHANLVVESLQLAPGPRAAGVEMRLEVEVRNAGVSDAPATTWELLSDQQRLPLSPLPALAAGERVRRTAPVRFDSPGAHLLSVALPADALEADNQRHCGVLLAARRSVLVVGDAAESLVYATALRPGSAVMTGWAPKLVAANEVSQITDLNAYSAVFVLDAPRLDLAFAQRLKDFLQSGGGVYWEFGPHCDRSFYNANLLGGSELSLAPWRLGLPTQSSAPPSGAPAVQVSEHPLTKVLTTARESFVPLTQVLYHHSLEQQQSPERMEIPLRTHTGAPLLVVDHSRPGPLVTLLTSTARSSTTDSSADEEPWSNLSTLPYFPLIVNEIAAQLAAPRLAEHDQLIGEPLAALPTATVQVADEGRFRAVTAAEIPSPPAGPVLVGGVYRIEGPVADAPEQLVAVNLDPRESALAITPLEQLRELCGDKTFSVFSAEELESLPDTRANSPLSAWLGVALSGSYLRPPSVARDRSPVREEARTGLRSRATDTAEARR